MSTKHNPRTKRWILVILVFIVVGIQLIPLTHDNPPVTADLDARPEVKALLRHSCYDCHSSETVWPWYAYVAPMSWAVVDHVHEGRSHLNFSQWGAMSPNRQQHALDDILDEIKEGSMPLPAYTMIHRDAILTPEQITTLTAWVETEKAREQSRAADTTRFEP